MTKRNALIVGISAVALVLAIISVSGDWGSTGNNHATGSSEPVQDEASDLAEPTSDKTTNDENPVETPVDAVASGEQPAPVVSESTMSWMMSVGFSNEYNALLSETQYLETQAVRGDMLAAQVLGNQLIGTEKGDQYLAQSAKLGSIKALHLLSTSRQFKAEGRLKNQQTGDQSAGDQHEASIDSLAYLFVARKRGDTYFTSNSIRNLLDRIEYTPEDIVASCNQAIVIYDELLQARLSEGLAPFDNSPPPDFPASTGLESYCDPDGR